MQSEKPIQTLFLSLFFIKILIIKIIKYYNQILFKNKRQIEKEEDITITMAVQV